jgi:outer membrane protein assembly factor BamE
MRGSGRFLPGRARLYIMCARMAPPTPTRPAVRRLCAGALIAALLGGCSTPRMPGIYRIDVQQGNVISQEQLAALERGMEKRKVRFILGTPLVADAFNQDRWDYYYSLEKMGEERVQRVISVFFEGDRLVRVSGGVRAATGPIAVPERKDEVVAVPEGYRDDGMLASITPGWFSQRAKRRARSETPPEPSGAQVPAGDTAPAREIEVSAEDERYLRDLLEGFGREAPDTAPAAATEAASAQDREEEGILSRWARRLGLKDEEPTPAARD